MTYFLVPSLNLNYFFQCEYINQIREVAKLTYPFPMEHIATNADAEFIIIDMAPIQMANVVAFQESELGPEARETPPPSDFNSDEDDNPNKGEKEEEGNDGGGTSSSCCSGDKCCDNCCGCCSSSNSSSDYSCYRYKPGDCPTPSPSTNSSEDGGGEVEIVDEIIEIVDEIVNEVEITGEFIDLSQSTDDEDDNNNVQIQYHPASPSPSPNKKRRLD